MKIGPALERGRKALRSKSETPLLDVQVLLADILRRDRAWILAHPEAPLNEQQYARYLEALKACQRGEALPHILGWWEFHGRRFLCPPQVLIPRPETELMVERALNLLRSPLHLRRTLDVGTGSGCVAVTLAAEIPNVQVIAVDIDLSALRVAQQYARYLEALKACQRGEALPHILGWWEFHGRRFLCPPQVLIPRPETELMVERALNLLRSPLHLRRTLDVGTGSGCVAVTLAAEIPNVQVIAVDIDLSVLHVAQQNALMHSVSDRVKLVCADLLSSVVGPFDLICANLPYIPTAELRRLLVGRREPWRALNGGVDGLEVLRRLVDMLPGKMTPGASVLLEIGEGQAQPLVEWIGKSLGFASVEVIRDLARKERLLHVIFGEDS